MKYDYLIIGRGLAGSTLAYLLLQRGKSVAIVDEGHKHTASKVAAGMANPFTGPRMAKSWKAELLFPFFTKFYKEVENQTQTSFFSERTIYRPFGSVTELNDWYGRTTLPNYQKIVNIIRESGHHSDFIHEPFGGVEFAGYVLQVARYLEALYGFFQHRGTLMEENFDESKLEILPEGVKYNGLLSKRIVFCTGYKVVDSRFFGWLPMAPVKGEILHIKLAKDFKTIYNQSCFIIPNHNGVYKAGSTYNRLDLTECTTELGKNEISKKLDTLLKMDYKIVDQEAGIRPGTISRRPLMGVHPHYENVFVFNGLGTKGVSLVPFYGDQFVKCLEDNNKLDAEVDIEKYYSLYFKSHFSNGI